MLDRVNEQGYNIRRDISEYAHSNVLDNKLTELYAEYFVQKVINREGLKNG